MHHLFVSLIILFSSFVKADTEPCDVDSYPVKAEKILHHANSFSLPAVYYKQGNARVIISTEKAIAFVRQNMSENTDYVAEAKSSILSSLKGMDGSEIIDQSVLHMPLEGLTFEELNVGIHVMEGYRGLFEGVLFNQEAAVEVDGKLVSNTKATYMVGDYPQPMEDFNLVHKLNVIYKTNLVFTTCWLDQK